MSKFSLGVGCQLCRFWFCSDFISNVLVPICANFDPTMIDSITQWLTPLWLVHCWQYVNGHLCRCFIIDCIVRQIFSSQLFLLDHTLFDCIVMQFVSCHLDVLHNKGLRYYEMFVDYLLIFMSSCLLWICWLPSTVLVSFGFCSVVVHFICCLIPFTLSFYIALVVMQLQAHLSCLWFQSYL
jgi:hypothetical protein